MKRRVVITGLGVISSIGNNKDIFFESLKQGKTGVREYEDETYPNYKRSKGEPNLVGYVKFEPHKYFSNKETSAYPLPMLMVLKAVDEALRDAKINSTVEKIGVILGTAVAPHPSYDRLNASLKAYGKADTKFLPFPQYYPSYIMEFLTQTFVEVVMKKYRFQGEGYGISGICASGALSVCLGARLIQYGLADTMICCGSDFFYPMQSKVFSRFKLLCSGKCCPFDKRRAGFQLGEGVGVVVLEQLDKAKEKGCHAYGEIVGLGITNDAYHLVIPSPNGKEFARAISIAVEEAKVNSDTLDYVSPVGRGCRVGDLKEAHGLHIALGRKVAENVPVNSIVPNCGYTLGATTILNLISTILQMNENYIFPVLNTESLDPKCKLNLIMKKPLRKEIDLALVCGFAFSGINSAIVVRKMI
ncbi:MAG: beta-ketoacyl-[acyl-carrier-protein] synthase family protein [Candidatus Njordarchaeales archaeon]